MPTKERMPWVAARNCLHNGVPVIEVAIYGVSDCRSALKGQAWLAWPCLEKGSITGLAASLRELADKVDALRGQEGGMWSQPWEEKP